MNLYAKGISVTNTTLIRLVKQMAECESVTENLKAVNQMLCAENE